MAVCDKCRKGYHIVCLSPILDDEPDKEWLCPVCRVSIVRSANQGSVVHICIMPCTLVSESQSQNLVILGRYLPNNWIRNLSI